MSDVTYKMESTGTTGATDNSIVSVDIQDDGFIEAILADLSGNGMDALDDNCAMEVAFGSTNSFGNNDVRGSIVMLRMQLQFLTSGAGALGKTANLSFGKGIPVSAGERIHMHLLATAGVTARGICYLYVVTSRGVVRRATRRRR